jgi:hypothetical protein
MTLTLFVKKKKQLASSSALQEFSSLLHLRYHPPDERLALIVSLLPGTSHEGKFGIDLLYFSVINISYPGLSMIRAVLELESLGILALLR